LAHARAVGFLSLGIMKLILHIRGSMQNSVVQISQESVSRPDVLPSIHIARDIR
jgi:hypothetical protein